MTRTPRTKATVEEKPSRTRRSRTEEAPTRSRTKKVEEAPAKKSRRAAAEEAPTRKPRRDAAEAPVRKSRRTPAVEEAPAKKSRRTLVAEEATPARKSRKAASEADAPAAPVFNPYGNLDDVLDSIEKHIGLTDGGLSTGERRMSSGLLMNDIVLGGGITAGWYTNFGQEQTCKTTNAVTMLISAINTDVPLIGYWDFEGCLTYDAQVIINGKQQHLGDLFVGLALKPYMAFDTSKLDITVDSPCGPQKVVAASYKGPKPITRIEVGEKELEGYKHPVLVCTAEGLLAWKYLEELRVGDLVATQP